MLNRSSEKILSAGLLGSLNLNPDLLQSLLSGCNHNLDEVTTLIEPVLNASARCYLTPFYVYAVSLGRIAFLATNLSSKQRSFSATAPSTSWSVGRSPNSGIYIAEGSVSRCHAVISHQASSHFFITDLGSCNGTWVNGTAIAPQKRTILRDGDILRFGSVATEFFSVMRSDNNTIVQDVTYS